MKGKKVRANQQAGAIPYLVKDGRVEVLLLTSRDTRRWILPKGNIEPGETPQVAAAAEALEEAGVKGVFDTDIPLGFYSYKKHLKSGESRLISVEVYVLRVTALLEKWRERKVRKRLWLPIADARMRIEEPGASPLLARLAEIEEVLVACALEDSRAKKHK